MTAVPDEPTPSPSKNPLDELDITINNVTVLRLQVDRSFVSVDLGMNIALRPHILGSTGDGSGSELPPVKQRSPGGQK